MSIKVIEFASVLAGPAVGMFFSELGAEVIKIENRSTGGDVTRTWKLPSENPDAPVSAYWASVNYRKQYLMLDLETPEDCSRAQALVVDADVLISNFRPEAARRFGLDPETLRRRHPGLIYAQLDAYPDPDDPRPAFDVVLQADTGFMFMTGEAGRPRVKMPVALIDLLAAHQLKEGILWALWQRERTGEGALVRTSLFESAVASLANQATNWLMAKHLPEPMGSQHPNIAPYGDQVVCSDGQVLVLAAGTQRHFERLCDAVGEPERSVDPIFATNRDRVLNRAALLVWLQEKFGRRPAEYWLGQLQGAGVPAAPVRDLQSLFAMPEAGSMVLHSEEEGVPTQRVKTVAFHVSAGYG